LRARRAGFFFARAFGFDFLAALARAFGFARATRRFAFGRARFLAPPDFAFGARGRGGELGTAAGSRGAAGVISGGNISGGIGEGISISSSIKIGIDSAALP